MKRRAVLLGMLAIVAIAPVRSSADGEVVLVIVHKENPVTRTDRSELSNIFLTKKRIWPSGDPIEPLNLPADSSARQIFDKAVHKLSPEEVGRYWIDRKIRGGAPPPQRLARPAAVVQAVLANRFAIGYVPAGTAVEGVKLIARIANGQVVAP